MTDADRSAPYQRVPRSPAGLWRRSARALRSISASGRSPDPSPDASPDGAPPVVSAPEGARAGSPYAWAQRVRAGTMTPDEFVEAVGDFDFLPQDSGPAETVQFVAGSWDEMLEAFDDGLIDSALLERARAFATSESDLGSGDSAADLTDRRIRDALGLMAWRSWRSWRSGVAPAGRGDATRGGIHGDSTSRRVGTRTSSNRGRE